MKFANRLVAAAIGAFLWMVLVLLTSCVGGSNTTPTGLPISITLVPSADTVSVGETVTVTANVYDQSNQGAIWTVDPVNFGTFTSQSPTSVTYAAPTNFTVTTKVTITATSITNPNVVASVKITASPVTVAVLPFAPQTINAGDQMVIISNVQGDSTNSGVTWTISPASGAGTLSNTSSLGTTYVAPSVVTTPSTVAINAASIVNPIATASLEITLLASGAGPNVAALRVDNGSEIGLTRPNAAFTSVSICNPGSQTACQTVDGILVDTGSYGLRILQSQIPLLKLPTLTDGQENVLENCASFPDGSYLWGPVAQADLNIASEVAPNVQVQVISSSSAAAPDTCSNGGTNNLNTPALLGANGILGVGPEPTDCQVAGKNLCDGSFQPVAPNLYYACAKKGCQTTDSPVLVPIGKQVTNPVTLFGSDNNGVLLQLPPVTDPQVSVVGTMIFGIGTEPNNDLGAATVYTTDHNGNITTLFNNQTLTSSFLDSGSDGLFFPGLMPICTVSTQFYCPPAQRNLQAVNQGTTQGSSSVSFTVDNADNLFSTYTGRAAFSDLAGPNGTYNSCSNGLGACSFDWGLPFFYGRTVFTQIDGTRPPFGSPSGPWWAY